MKTISLQLQGNERQLAFPYQVDSLLIQKGFPGRPCRCRFPEQLEVTLRLGPSEGLFPQRTDGAEYRSRFPHVLLKRPGLEYECPGGHRYDVFAFRYSVAATVSLQTLGVLEGSPVWDLELNPELVQPMREVEELARRSQELSVADQIDSLCFLLLNRLLLIRKLAHVREDGQAALVRRIASRLQLDFTKELDIDALAKAHGMSRRTLFRLWQRHMPLSPACYVLELRLERARQLLLDTDEKVLQIASELGFKEENHFRSAFKRRFGVTPGQYRSSFRNAEC